MSVARFIASRRTEHGIPHAVTCRALDVSESWFYKWHNREPTARQQRRAQLTVAIGAEFDDSGRTYGSPRIGLELREKGWQVSDNTIAAIMAENGWFAEKVKRRRGCTKPGKRPVAPDLVRRQFTAVAPDVLWCGDVTEIPTEEGKLYLASVEERFSGRLLGYALSPQKLIRRAYEQDPDAVRRWLEQDYPALAARARREGAVVLWLDQTGIRSDAAVGRTWAPTGRTPVVGKTGKRFSVNAMCAISNKGELYFTVYTGSFNAGVFLPFLDRLTRHLDRKVHLIVDGHPVHRRTSVRQWTDARREVIEMHFLPGYSPELNPDEILGCRPRTHRIHRRGTENPGRVGARGPILPPPAPEAARPDPFLFRQTRGSLRRLTSHICHSNQYLCSRLGSGRAAQWPAAVWVVTHSTLLPDGRAVDRLN